MYFCGNLPVCLLHFTRQSYPIGKNRVSALWKLWEPRRKGSVGAELDETPLSSAANASRCLDARRAQLRGLSGANRAQRAEQTFHLLSHAPMLPQHPKT